MENNLELWNKVKQPPKTALRQIQAGRLSGKTDINPQWRYQAMTEQFGPIGIGWYPEIIRGWTESAPDGQVFCFVDILLYVKIDGEWSKGIPGTGGNMLIAKERAGLHANDEAYKMAYTDALSVPMKMLGFASDVYAGLWDGSKYRDVAVKKDTPKTPDIYDQSKDLDAKESVDTTPLPESQKLQESTPSTHTEGFIDQAWFKEKIELFQSRGIKKWSNAMVLKSLNTLLGPDLECKTINEALQYLTKDQADGITISILETEKML